MKARSVLIIESTVGAGPALSRTLHQLYPSWSVAPSDPAVAMSVLRDGGADTVVLIATEADGGNALAEWIRDHHPSITYEAFEISETESLEPGVIGLAQRIGRSLALRERRSAPDLVRIVAGLQRIPVVSSIYEAVCSGLAFNLTAGDDYGLAEVAKLVCRDPGLAVQILKLANAPIPGAARSVTSIPEAVSLLGSGRISSALLGVSVSDQIQMSGVTGRVIERDWRDAVATAQLSRKIADHEGMTDGDLDTAYLAGLLHNVGRLSFAVNLPWQFSANEWPNQTTTRLVAEREVFGAGHTDVAAPLLGLWGLDDEVVEAVAFYADPVEAASKDFGTLAAVHGAVVVLGRGRLEWDKEFLLESGLADRVDQWSRLGDVQQPLATAGS